MRREEVFRMLEPLFFNENVEKVGHNVKFDLHAVSQHYGYLPDPPYYDTHIAAWLDDVTKRGKLGLQDCVKRYLRWDLEKGVGERIEAHAFSVVAKYSALDAQATWDLYQHLEKYVFGHDKTLARLRDLEMSVLEPVLEMESTGTRIDTNVLAGIGAGLEQRIAAAEKVCVAMAGRVEGKPFNLRSNRQKQIVLYERRKLRPTVPTPKGKEKMNRGETLETTDWSVSADALNDLTHDALVQQLQSHAMLTKLHGTYVIPYLGGDVVRSVNGKEKHEHVESKLEAGRIHTQFVQTGAESGRFSSRNPNLQNVPNRSPEGRQIRKVFVADPDEMLIVADYSQIEPRIIASLSGDKTMVETYRDGGDVYQAVADRMGVSRQAGKTLVLAIAYGVGPSKIANDIGCSMQEARGLMSYFEGAFTAVPRHKAKVIAAARRNLYSSTVLGRKRRLPEIKARDREVAGKAERQAYNHRIQGSAADVMKLALVGIYDALPSEARMLMTVHDEVVVSAPKDFAHLVGEIVKTQMESVTLFDVPLVAEVGIGQRWSDAH
jgi:DNA polymerase-1